MLDSSGKASAAAAASAAERRKGGGMKLGGVAKKVVPAKADDGWDDW
jgi:hypothetical protein